MKQGQDYQRLHENRQLALLQEMVQRRIAQLTADGDAAEADRLRATAAKPLFHLLRSIDYRNEASVQAIIAAWGPRVIDEAALWDALDRPASLRANG